jgi:hypothetical protein
MTYALCGFANLGSLGIMIGGLGAMVPERRDEIVALGLKSDPRRDHGDADDRRGRRLDHLTRRLPTSDRSTHRRQLMDLSAKQRSDSVQKASGAQLLSHPAA